MSGESTLAHLECGACGRQHESSVLQALCSACKRPLLARYDLEKARRTLRGGAHLHGRPSSIWRYREVMPVRAGAEPLDLGEGGTPLRPARRLGGHVGIANLLVKDESLNPTGSFKARGMAAAVTAARDRGARRLVVPTAGNAGMAMAAYAAAAGLTADVFCPEDTPAPFRHAAALLGASVHTVSGLIDRCGVAAREQASRTGAFDVSTFREPYRVEGKKTMGYELVEQLGGELPEVIVYPTGGGTGLVGMWKAFEEMQALGWIGAARPRMVSVQATGCAPLVRAFHAGASHAEPWVGGETSASGLRVPASLADGLMLHALRESGGTALAVSDEEMVDGARQLGAWEGICAAPEGGATLAAALRLRDQGEIAAGDRVVLFNTGTSLSYLDALV